MALPSMVVEKIMNVRPIVLVVDDEPGMRDMLSYELSQDGFDVETAENGTAAVEAMKRRKFDVAVTDLKMPGMDGMATVEALRAIDPDIEVIVATGYGTIESAVACMKQGAYDYVQKPFDLDELKQLLEKAMQKSHLQGMVALYEASRALLATLSHSDLIALVVDLGQRVLRADASGLLLWRDGSTDIETHGLPFISPALNSLLLQLARAATENLVPVSIPSSAGTDLPSCRYASALVYPLMGRDRVLGCLALLRDKESPSFSHSELRNGTVFASQLALSLDNARLYEELEGKIRDVVETHDQLVRAEKLAMAGRLAGAVAHEINNPLAFVQNNMANLRDYSSTVGALWLAAKAAALYLRGLCAPDAEEHADRIIAAGNGSDEMEQIVRDVAGVIDDTLEGVRRITDLVSGFSRLAAPGESTTAGPVDILTLVNESVASLPQSFQEKIRTVTGGQLENSNTHGCREDLRASITAILGHLCCRNEVGHPSPDMLDLAVDTREGSPCLVISYKTLKLTDTQRQSLFDPHLKVDASDGRTVRLDIELAMAHQILRRNGAHIWLDPKTKGKGLKLRIVFPSAGL